MVSNKKNETNTSRILDFMENAPGAVSGSLEGSSLLPFLEDYSNAPLTDEQGGRIFGEEGDEDDAGARTSYMIIGGSEQSVGGWVAYENMRRDEQGSHYFPDRTYIGAQDILESYTLAQGRIGGGGGGSPPNQYRKVC